ncbi:DCL protein (DUF3223) [Tasmannia lanceolata]|uniref:DCL protein (DUF3223) n=1 Tax=Tasmannia lanceolata TaxID=3420 RepID=UPI004062F26F
MASIYNSPSLLLHRNPNSLPFSPSTLSFPSLRTPQNLRLRALKTGPDRDRFKTPDQTGDPALLRKPATSSSDVEGSENEEGKRNDDERVDWEDQILEDTVPLVGFVRMILHSGKYDSGDRLSAEHEKTILERLLPYHPEFEKKIGCGIDFITVGYHPDFESSRCLFIVRKDGEVVDFSYWKCIKGLIRKNYPLYADSFILRHFRRRRHSE